MFDYDELTQSSKFGIKYYEHGVYKGELKFLAKSKSESIRHGIGVMLYHTGRVYEGQWAFDKREGKGFEKFIAMTPSLNETTYCISSPKFYTDIKTKHCVRLFSCDSGYSETFTKGNTRITKRMDRES